jgi:N-acetylglucosaminyldiphosphoundecaprenol N-acetyl-beta-D-mannosaminyltransferase
MGSPDTFDLMGIRLDGISHDSLIDRIVSDLEADRGGWLVNPNLDCLRICVADDEVRDLVNRADLVVADGVPLVWAARLRGDIPPDRVAGSTLIWSLAAAAGARGIGVFLLGGADDEMDARAAAALRERCPDLRVAWHVPPFGFENDPEATRAIDDALDAFGSAVVFCGLGFPKQERLMDRIAGAHPSSWFLGSGASISFVAGRTARAPVWMQDRGLEWLFRLVSEPRRLWRRYIVHDLPFAVRLFAWAGSRRFARKG